MIEMINAISQTWINSLNVILLPNTIFLFVLIAALFLLRKTTANLRYSVSLLGLIKLVIPPFIFLPILNPNIDQTIKRMIINLQPQISSDLISIKMINTSLSFTSILFLFWVSIFLIIIGRTLLRTVHYYKIVKNASFIEELNLKGKRIKLFECEEISTPLTFGFGSKSIYVPKLWQNWSADCQKLILVHEFEHIRRHDGIVQTLQIIINALYFFHPLVWILNKQINDLREMACDDATTKKEKKSSVLYSKCLVEIAEGMLKTDILKPPAIALLKRKKNFLKRVKYQLEENAMTNLFQKIALVSVIISVFMLTTITFTQSISKTEQEIVSIHVKSESEIIVNGKVTDLSSFENTLKEIINQNNQTVSLKIAQSVRMGIIYDIQSTLRKLSLIRLNYSLESGDVENITLPPKGSKEMLKNIPKKNLCRILINKKGAILVDDEVKTRELMKTHVKKRFLGNQNLIVDVWTEKNTHMQDYMNVLNDLKKIGITRISVDNQKIVPPPPKGK
jgi:beta-lactamase regulating signal transducer with metallopeptidase domain